MDVSLFHCSPCGVHVHDTLHHPAAIAYVGGHAGRIVVLVGVRFRDRWVHCGLCVETKKITLCHSFEGGGER